MIALLYVRLQARREISLENLDIFTRDRPSEHENDTTGHSGHEDSMAHC